MTVPVAAVSRGSMLRAVTSSYGQGLLSTAVGLLLTPLYLAYLGTEMFGLWATVLSVAGYLSMGGLGIPQAAGNLMAQAAARGERNEVAHIFATAVRTATVIAIAGALLLGALVGAGTWGTRLLGRGTGAGSLATTLIAIVAAGLMLNLPLEQARAALRAWQRVDVDQAAVSLGRLAGLLVTAGVFWLGGGVVAAAIVHSTSLILPGVAAWTIGYFWLRMPLRVSGADRRHVALLLRPGSHFFLLMLAGALIWGTDNIVIATHLGAAAVTPYSVATRLFMVVTGWLTMGLAALTPTVAALWGGGETARLQRLFVVVLRMGLAIALLLAVELGVFGRDFLALWTGGRTHVDIAVFSVLWGVFLLRAVGSCFEVMLLGTSQHHTYAYIALVEGFVNLALSLLLVRTWGTAGVAVGTLVSLSLFTGWYVPWRSMMLAGLSWRRFWRGVLRPVALPAAVSLAIAVVLSHLCAPVGWVAWLACTGITAAAFVALYALLGATTDEKVLIRQVLRRTSQPLAPP